MDRGCEQILSQGRYTDGQQAYEKMFNITNHQGNANQNNTKIPPHTCENGYNHQDKKQQMLEMLWRNRNPHSLLVGMQTGAASMENSMEIPQKIKIEIRYDPAISLLVIYPKNLK